MAQTKVMACDCKSEQQDSIYGKGNRLHNLSETNGIKKAYCTVCCPSQRKVMKELFPMPHVGVTKHFPAVTRSSKSY